jgi:hypothetical protein
MRAGAGNRGSARRDRMNHHKKARAAPMHGAVRMDKPTDVVAAPARPAWRRG